MIKLKKNNFSKRIKDGFFWTFFGGLGQIFFAILVSAILARLLEPSDFGLIASVNIIVGFGGLFVDLGMGAALVQTEELTAEKISSTYLFSLGIGVLLTLIFLIANPYITLLLDVQEILPILNIFVFLFPIISFVRVSFSLLQRNFSFKVLAGIEITAFIFGYGIPSVLLAYYGYGVWALAFGTVFSVIIKSIICYITMPYTWYLFCDKKILKSLFSFGKGFTLVNLFNYTALKGDQLVIGKLLGMDSLGFYNRSFGLMNIPESIIGGVISKVLFPRFAEIQNDKVKLTRDLEISFHIIFLISIPIACWCWVLAPEIVSVFLGEKWKVVTLLFRVLLISMISRMGYRLAGAFVKGIGAMDEYVKSQFIYLLFVIIGCWIGSFFGLLGIGVGMNVANIIMFLMLLQIVNKYSYLTWSSYKKLLLIPISFSIVSTFLLVLFLKVISLADLHAILTLIFSGILLLCLSSGFYFFNDRFKYIQGLPAQNWF